MLNKRHLDSKGFCPTATEKISGCAFCLTQWMYKLIHRKPERFKGIESVRTERAADTPQDEGHGVFGPMTYSEQEAVGGSYSAANVGHFFPKRQNNSGSETQCWGKQLPESRSEPWSRNGQDVPNRGSHLLLKSDGCVPPVPPPFLSIVVILCLNLTACWVWEEENWNLLFIALQRLNRNTPEELRPQSLLGTWF